jgi:S-adenosylmethionine:tRNA ribosyltransferase-isomerase
MQPTTFFHPHHEIMSDQSSPSALPADFALASYEYELDESRIAQTPSHNREDSKLLVLDRSKPGHQATVFSSLADHLPENALLVANNTKVLPARLLGRKESGGRAEFLLLTPLVLIRGVETDSGWSRAEVQGLLRASKSPKPGSRIIFSEDLFLTVRTRGEFGQATVTLHWRGDLTDHFLSGGHMPLPPYIRREDQEEDRERYQTVFAREDKLGSVAAPTAGLHFTPAVRQSLKNKSISWEEITLYVGYGTFSPLRCRDIRDHDMHAEYIEVSTETAEAIARAKAQGRPIVALGTTTVRTLESMYALTGGIHPFAGWTDLFIMPGYRFRVIDHLITNFHLPGSSLIVLVSALAGRDRIKEAYAFALDHDFRFFSYGDAMLIL